MSQSKTHAHRYNYADLLSAPSLKQLAAFNALVSRSLSITILDENVQKE